MPTYQYRCTNCGNELEVVQKFTDPSLTECPACQGALRKVFNAVGVVFKGSGFYKTDSRSDAKGKASSGAAASKSAESSTDSAAGSSTSSSSDSGGGSSSSSSGSSTGNTSTSSTASTGS